MFSGRLRAGAATDGATAGGGGAPAPATPGAHGRPAQGPGPPLRPPGYGGLPGAGGRAGARGGHFCGPPGPDRLPPGLRPADRGALPAAHDRGHDL